MRIHKWLAAAAGTVAVLAIATAPANAAEDPVTGADNPVPTTAVIATHNGKQIDLADGWDGATICTEVAVDDVRCYDDETDELLDLADESPGHAAAARAEGLAIPGALATSDASMRSMRSIRPAQSADGTVGTQAIGDCTYGYSCLFNTTTYGGRILRFLSAGTRNLDAYSPSFRDMAGSGCNNRQSGGTHVTDFRTGLPDPELYISTGNCTNFASADYQYGGDWNNKADSITL